SYIGVDIRANLFNGFKDRYKVEAKRYKMLSNFHKYIDYKELIFKNISNQKLLINEIKSSLISKKESLKAAKKYLELIKKSYDNGLSDSETLSNAISNYVLYLSEYKKEKLELIFQIGKSWLLSGIVPFKRAIKK
ncbi:MAG: TolC family protein, partial [Epsilonproteobacteria bacterium]|nr:TolC family protein [Campylobacterota bacterium]